MKRNYELNGFYECHWLNLAAEAADLYEFVTIRNEVAKFYPKQFVSFVKIVVKNTIITCFTSEKP